MLLDADEAHAPDAQCRRVLEWNYRHQERERHRYATDSKGHTIWGPWAGEVYFRQGLATWPRQETSLGVPPETQRVIKRNTPSPRLNRAARMNPLYFRGSEIP